MLNVPIAAIFETLSTNLGTAYVNDFNAFGRVWQVRAQADQRFRVEQEDIGRLKVRSATGALVPLGTLVEVKNVAGPDLIQRYNLFTSGAAAGRRRARRLDRHRARDHGALGPRGAAAGSLLRVDRDRFQERATGNTALYIFALGRAARLPGARRQYESWGLPLAIILVVPDGDALGARAASGCASFDNNILTQIGLVCWSAWRRRTRSSSSSSPVRPRTSAA
jgi:HAE1 family hydrophobic/amphiphilic exporter-1